MQTEMQSEHTPKSHVSSLEEYVTIIAASAGEVMRQFQARGLDAQGYAIVGRMARHHFAFVKGAGSDDMFDGEMMLAATFMRQS